MKNNKNLFEKTRKGLIIIGKRPDLKPITDEDILKIATPEDDGYITMTRYVDNMLEK